MYIVTTQFDRPSADIPYYIDTNPALKLEFLRFVDNCFNHVWPETTMYSVEESDLRQITVVTYADQETLMHYLSWHGWAFPTFFADRDAYCAANNITITRTEETS